MKKRNHQPSNIENLKNEYTQEKNLQNHREKKQKRHMQRRILLISLIGGIIIVGLSITILVNRQEVAKMNREKVQAEKNLKKVQAEQRLLNNQINQLKDDDFVTKLARSKYYLSKDGEIIFSLPEDNAAKILEETKKKAEETEKNKSSEEKKDSTEENSSN